MSSSNVPSQIMNHSALRIITGSVCRVVHTKKYQKIYTKTFQNHNDCYLEINSIHVHFKPIWRNIVLRRVSKLMLIRWRYQLIKSIHLGNHPIRSLAQSINSKTRLSDIFQIFAPDANLCVGDQNAKPFPDIIKFQRSFFKSPTSVINIDHLSFEPYYRSCAIANVKTNEVKINPANRLIEANKYFLNFKIFI